MIEKESLKVLIPSGTVLLNGCNTNKNEIMSLISLIASQNWLDLLI